MSMFRKLPPFLRGILFILVSGLPLSIMLCWALSVAILQRLVPFSQWRVKLLQSVHVLPAYWVKLNTRIMAWFMSTRWQVIGAEKVDLRHWYVLLANHQSWLDIFVLQQVLGDKVPAPRYFMKRELLWLPVIGQICWLLDFPFMRRYSREYLAKYPEKRGKDIEATRKSCEKFKHTPVTIINFAEGTRFTFEKHRKQGSPYKHLLRPRAGGIAFTIMAMAQSVQQVIDVTIVYKAQSVTFWQFCCGLVGEIIVHVRTLPLTPELIGDYQNDFKFQKRFQCWINQVWQEKDQLIEQLKEQSAPCIDYALQPDKAR